MSKYDKLWNYVKTNNKDELILSFDEVNNILGFTLDHSFLTYKKELTIYKNKVQKISLKNKTITFKRI